MYSSKADLSVGLYAYIYTVEKIKLIKPNKPNQTKSNRCLSLFLSVCLSVSLGHSAPSSVNFVLTLK